MYNLKHVVRKLDPYYFRVARRVFKKRMSIDNPYLDFEHHVDPDCMHDFPCECYTQIQGKNQCHMFSARLQTWRKDDAIHEIIASFSSTFKLEGNSIVPGQSDIETMRFVSQLKLGGNIKLVPGPPIKVGLPASLPLVGPNPGVVQVFKDADMDFISFLLGKSYSPDNPAHVEYFEQQIWNVNTCYKSAAGRFRPIKLECNLVRPMSIYNSAFGLINGRPTCVSACADLYPSKYANAVLKQAKTVHEPIPGYEAAWDGIDSAFRYMYHHFGTADKIGKLHIPFTVDDLEGMPLGTSGGLNKPETGNRKRPPIVQVEDVTLKISASGKKYENLPTDLRSLYQWLLDPNAPDLAVIWNIVPKNENFIEFIKQMSVPEWDLLLQKLRTYVIPSSIFILMERMVGKIRFRLERGHVIQVGHSHSRGGTDRIAMRLKINFLNDLKAILVEGDVRNFDQSVWDRFVDLYYSHGMVYDAPNTPEYEVRLRITKFLIRAILCRLTHLFGNVWGIQTGGVPSGVLNTSHMDSWIMALWFFLFGVYQIKTALPAHQEQLEEALLNLVCLIVYGDDHVWNKTDDPVVAMYFSGHNFGRFMKTFFGVEVRGIKDGVSFVSDTCMGMLTRCGVTFLRHQFVRNPYFGEPGQCRYLPFRECREYFARVAWGKESRERDYLDIILSCLGHAYGTYGSNIQAWWGLRMIYLRTIKAMGLVEAEALAQVVANARDADFKELRRKDISREEILNGFPTLETLKRKNVWDPDYHEKIWADESTVQWEF